MCWTMCIREGLLAEPVDGRDERRDECQAGPPAKTSRRHYRRGARAVLDAHAPPAGDVGRRRQADERQGTRVERPRSVRSHCARLSQSGGGGVTRSRASIGAVSTRLPAANPFRARRCSGALVGRARPARLLGVRRDGRSPASRCAGAAGASCASCAGPRCQRCGLPAPCGRRCSPAGAALARAWAPVAFEGPARALVHALKFRGALAVADAMAALIVAGAPPGLLAAPAALVPVPHPPASPPRARLRPRGPAGRRDKRCARGWPGERPAWPVRECRRAKPDRRARRAAHRAVSRCGRAGSALPRRVGRRRPHHGRDARGMRFGAATSGRLHGVCGRLRTRVEMT